MRHFGGICGLVAGLGLWTVLGCDSQADPDYQGEALASLQGRVETTADITAADVGVLWLASSPGDECSGPTYRCETQGFASANPDQQACFDACGEMPDCDDDAAIEAWEPCMAACGETAKVEYSPELTVCHSAAVGQSVPVTGGFPAQFSLDLLTEPPPEALLPDETGSRVALAYIVALEPGTENVSVESGWEDTPAWLVGGSETHILAYVADPIADGSPWATLLGGSLDVGYHLVEYTGAHDCVSDPVAFYERLERAGAADGLEPPVVDDEYQATFATREGICGNGVCEPGGAVRETCNNCSDCECSGSGASPTSSGIIMSTSGYSCTETSQLANEAPDGFDTEITLTISPDGSVVWPHL